jgi:tetratricopeptide (TPR) repeat protein
MIMHSELICNFCCWDATDSALTILDSFDDIDILYNNCAIIRTAMSKNQATFLRAALDYFENKQFPIKDGEYEKASHKLIEILEEYNDGSNLDISAIVSDYLGNDIAILQDVDELPVHFPGQHYIPLISASVSKLSNIELCVEAAKIGDANIVRKHLDIDNRSHKIAVVSAAVHNLQESVIDTVVDMMQSAKKEATVLRLAGDIFTQSHLFKKAEEYYNKSLKMHPNYYVTYSKMGALYQCWSSECSNDTDTPQKLMLNKAIESYDKALGLKPKHIKYAEVQERLDIVVEQLKHVHLVQDSEDAASVGYKDDTISEILSYVSEEDSEQLQVNDQDGYLKEMGIMLDNISLSGIVDPTIEEASDFP